MSWLSGSLHTAAYGGDMGGKCLRKHTHSTLGDWWFDSTSALHASAVRMPHMTSLPNLESHARKRGSGEIGFSLASDLYPAGPSAILVGLLQNMELILW